MILLPLDRFLHRHAVLFPRAARGQSMVEFTLVLPFLLIFIFGIIDFALAIHTEVDFNGAVSTGVRQATLVADPATGAEPLWDDAIGQVMFQTVRSDDPNRTNYYDIKLVKSRPLGDTVSGGSAHPNTYENFFAYARVPVACNPTSDPATISPFVCDPYEFLSQNQSQWPIQCESACSYPTPCQYFYEAHHDSSDPSKVYLDASERIAIAADDPHQAAALNYVPTIANNAQFSPANPPPADPNLSLSKGCGRSTPSACSAGYPMLSGTQNDGDGNLCYYYPDERTNTIDASRVGDAALPDLLEVDLSYTYRVLGDYVTSHTALGLGYTVVEHARARLEPVTNA